MKCFVITTYMMRREVLEALNNASLKTGKRFETLIVQCMRMMMREHTRYLRDLQQIEYQKRKDENNGLPILKSRVKVKINIREYNYFQDVRKFFSRSISLNIAVAVLTYLESVLMELLDEIDDANSYPFQNYAFIVKCIKNINTFQIWWGIPPDLDDLFK
ncbi:MAG: hypothetical protein N2316_11155 [Spirochaetes bacterium]|nr:hypothetical protein [Spirochaetota bacterium]